MLFFHIKYYKKRQRVGVMNVKPISGGNAVVPQWYKNLLYQKSKYFFISDLYKSLNMYLKLYWYIIHISASTDNNSFVLVQIEVSGFLLAQVPINQYLECTDVYRSIMLYCMTNTSLSNKIAVAVMNCVSKIVIGRSGAKC